MVPVDGRSRQPPPGSRGDPRRGRVVLHSALGGDLDGERPGGRRGPLLPRPPGPVPVHGCGSTARCPSAGRHGSTTRSATFVGRAAPAGSGEPGPIVVRHRYVGRGMREDIVVRNFGDEPAYVEVEVEVEADFAAGARGPGRRGRRGAGRARGSSGPGGSCSCGAAAVAGRLPGHGVHGRRRRAAATLRWEAIIPARRRRSVSVSVCADRRRRRGRARPRASQPVERAVPPAGPLAAGGPVGVDRPRRHWSRRSPAAPRTSARCGCSTPTSRSGRWWPPARRGG